MKQKPASPLAEPMHQVLRWLITLANATQGILRAHMAPQFSLAALPAELGSWSQRNGRLFESWHASVAKSTSHLVAMTGANKDLSKTLLINLDNDNLAGDSYLGGCGPSSHHQRKNLARQSLSSNRLRNRVFGRTPGLLGLGF